MIMQFRECIIMANNALNAAVQTFLLHDELDYDVGQLVVQQKSQELRVGLVVY